MAKTPATIHVITKKRNGSILWDAVWCEACAKQHQQTFAGDKTLTTTLRPWLGAERVCDSCDEPDDLAPELRTASKALAVLLMVFLPLMAACSSPTAPTHDPVYRWNLTGQATATTQALGMPCGTQKALAGPISTGLVWSVPLSADTILTTWTTLNGPNVDAVFTLTDGDLGLCAWGWSK